MLLGLRGPWCHCRDLSFWAPVLSSAAPTLGTNSQDREVPSGQMRELTGLLLIQGSEQPSCRGAHAEHVQGTLGVHCTHPPTLIARSMGQCSWGTKDTAGPQCDSSSAGKRVLGRSGLRCHCLLQAGLAQGTGVCADPGSQQRGRGPAIGPPRAALWGPVWDRASDCRKNALQS